MLKTHCTLPRVNGEYELIASSVPTKLALQGSQYIELALQILGVDRAVLYKASQCISPQPIYDTCKSLGAIAIENVN